MTDIVDLNTYRDDREGSIVVDMNNWRPRLGRRRIPDKKWLKLKEHNRTQREMAHAEAIENEAGPHLDFAALNAITEMRDIGHALGFVSQGSPTDDAQFAVMNLANPERLTLV